MKGNTLFLVTVGLGILMAIIVLFFGAWEVGMYFSYIAGIAAAIMALAFSLMHVMRSPTESKWMLLGLGANLLIFVVSYLIADGEVIYSLTGEELAGEGTAKIVSSGLYTLYVLFGVAALGIIVTEVKALLKL